MVGEEKSTAQSYTKKYPHINFMSINDYERGGILGDVNGDGELTIDDVTLIQMYIVGMPVENFNVELADVNEDGQISIYDATLVQIKIVNK